MSICDRPLEDKYCFAYCGDEVCNCIRGKSNIFYSDYIPIINYRIQIKGYSPGPWKAADKACWFRGQRNPDDGKITITAGTRGVVANVYGRANATMIAAAPEMYEFIMALANSGNNEAIDFMKGISNEYDQHP